MIEAILAAIFGLLIGSFLNVCIYRMPRDLSVVRPRSYCPECDRGIAWYDNVPLLSYALLGGKCRHCRTGIPYRYPLVEFLTAACFFAVFLVFPTHALAVKYCVFSAIIVALVFTDLEERILPDEFTIGGTIVGLIFAYAVPQRLPMQIWGLIFTSIRDPRVLNLIEFGFAAAFSSFALWSIGYLYKIIRHREGLGLGDVKMVAMLGAFLGLQGVLLTLMAGSVLGAVIGLGYIMFAGKDAATYELPFGFFLGVGGLAVAFMLAHP